MKALEAVSLRVCVHKFIFRSRGRLSHRQKLALVELDFSEDILSWLIVPVSFYLFLFLSDSHSLAVLALVFGSLLRVYLI